MSSSLSEALSIYELLLERARRHPRALALLAPGRSPASNAQLFAQAENTTKALNAAGYGRGDCIAVVLPNGPELVAAFLSVTAAAVCAPLNPGFRPSEFEFYLRDLGARALIVDAGSSSPAGAIAAECGVAVIELIANHDAEAGSFSLSPPKKAVQPTRRTPDELAKAALILHTSGTTSRPKMVPLTEENLCVSALHVAESLALTRADRCLNVMPMFHIHGLVGATLATMASGGSLVCTAGMRAPLFFEWLETFLPTWYTAVPSVHQAVLAQARQIGCSPAKTSLRLIRSSSSSLPPHVMADLEAQFAGTPVIEAYGMTEATHQIACNPLPPRMRKPGSVGFATGTSIAILAADGTLAGPGEVGEVAIAGPNVTAGHLNNPEANETAFVDGWLRTGDLGVWDGDGYLFLRGRIKEIINRGGSKIAPREIEEILLDHLAIAEAVAFPLPHPSLGEEVGAAVVLAPGAEADEESISAFAASRLASFKQPRRIFIVDEIPKGQTGKPQRIGMAERLGLEPSKPEPELVADFTLPRTTVERTIARIWQSILGLERIGLQDDFFRIGGDSLTAEILAFELERMSGNRYGLADIMRAPTVGEQRALVERPSARQERARFTTFHPAGSRPPFFCDGAGPLFSALASRLGTDQPFIALHFPDVRELPNPCRLEDIAAFHVETIRSVQPEGPYFIGGFCSSGVVAYEVARQLSAAGQRVGLLVGFDVVNNTCQPHGHKLGTRFANTVVRLRALRYHAGMLRRCRPSAMWDYIWARARWHLVLIGYRVLRASYPLRRRLDLVGHRHLSREFEAILRWATARYHPPPSHIGRMVLFRSAERRLRRHSNPQMGWGDRITGELRVYDIPGGHHDMFREPNVGITARALSTELRQVQAESTECCAFTSSFPLNR
jgi:acyl-CoA synthetase (AMP-forming)/AMP-acid ligase II/thioesterase domain-containing protein